MPLARIGDLGIVWDIAGPVDAPPVLLINGLGAARGGWDLQVPPLAERYRVITFDNRDVGETGAGTIAAYGMDRFAEDAIGLLEHLEIRSAHVIGASMGGTIAQEMALARPDMVRSLQIVCSWPRTDAWLAELISQWQAMFAEMGGLAWARNSWLWVFTHRWFSVPELVAQLEHGAASYPFPQSAEMFTRQCGAVLGFDARDRLGAIACPVQVVAGAEDLLTPVRFSRELASAIPGAALTILPDVGHGMFWETSALFNETLLAFLNANRAR